MDWHLALLLLAIVVTYLAWRRAQRASELERARTAALEEPRWRYVLLEVPPADGFGGGYEVAGSSGASLDWRELRWDDHGVEVAEVEVDTAAAPAHSLVAGAGVQLEAGTAPSGAAEVGVWDDARTARIAVVAGPLAARLLYILEKGELGDCIVLREAGRDGADARVRLLLVHRDTDVEA